MKTKSSTAHIDLDAILVEIGETSRYQILHYVLFGVVVIFTSSSYLSYIFTAGQLDYRCKIPECDVTDRDGRIEFQPAWLPLAVPFDNDASGMPDRCSRYRPIDAETAVLRRNGSAKAVCPATAFNQSTVMRCDEFVFASDEVTIVNAVS